MLVVERYLPPNLTDSFSDDSQNPKSITSPSTNLSIVIVTATSYGCTIFELIHNNSIHYIPTLSIKQ